MKKLFLSLMALAMTAFAFTSCEDVPQPYDTPTVNVDTTKVIPSGTGTADDPYNVAMAKQLVNSGTYPTGEVYVKGVITSLQNGTYTFNEQFHNYTYCINDKLETTGQFVVFRGKNLGNTDFTSADELQVGDTVIVCGKFTTHNNEPQLDQGNYLYYLNGKGVQSASAGLNATFNEGQDDFTIENVSLPEGLDYVWKYNAKTDNYSGYMKASAYKKANLAAQSRLVSPAFSLEGLTKATLSFQHAGKFFGKGEGDMAKEIQVLASTDGKTWTKLTISAYPSGNDWTFVDATCDLSAFAGKKTVYIAFQYTSTADAAPTWEVKNVVVK